MVEHTIEQLDWMLDNTLLCETCRKRFETERVKLLEEGKKRADKAHGLIGHAEKPWPSFVCNLCGEKFATERRLLIHIGVEHRANIEEDEVKAKADTWRGLMAKSDAVTYVVDNARIESVSLGREDHGIPSAYIMLDYGGSVQGFGGYGLNGWAMEAFVMGVLDTLEVGDWKDLVGKIVRARHDDGKVYAIGHPYKDKWFTPEIAFAKAKEAVKKELHGRTE